jgi:hypothetical protein
VTDKVMANCANKDLIVHAGFVHVPPEVAFDDACRGFQNRHKRRARKQSATWMYQE